MSITLFWKFHTQTSVSQMKSIGQTWVLTIILFVCLFLKKHTLFGTGTTAGLIEERLNLEVEAFKSGPMGGDQQLGAKISEGAIDLMIFFWDPLEAQPHDPDVKALLRIAVLYDIPVANNRATADFILSSPLMNQEYKRHIIDYASLMKERRKQFSDIV